MTETEMHDFSRIREIACIILGAMAGFLISSPASAAISPGASVLATIAFTCAGGLVGYKRRQSNAFMYFALLCVLVLLTTYAYSIIQSEKTTTPVFSHSP